MAVATSGSRIMNVPHLLTEEEIFRHAAVVSSPEERVAYVKQVCGSNQDLLRRVLALLEAESQDDGFLESCLPTVRDSLQDSGCSETPRVDGESKASDPGADVARLDAYSIVEKIGEGGMGEVYLVRQTGELKRLAALKVLREELLTDDAIARFEDERMVLAKMDHPNIAKVFDCGRTDSGRPYFVMEWLRGIPITQYCDEHQLNIAERLELFIQVCQGVQHAHYKGVIHRDLKPSNMIVSEFDHVAVPKIIDFGIAKVSTMATWSDGNQEHKPTLLPLGTLSYMSPEQLDAGRPDLDTRSDIYSLGVVLYELLSGTQPVFQDLAKACSFDDFVAIVSKHPPRRPSLVVAMAAAGPDPKLATARRTNSKALTRQLLGDLDWITLKTLEKDPGDRYQTLVQLTYDLQLCLEQRPILARESTFAIKFMHFCRRHRGAVALGALLACVLVLAVSLGVVNRWQAYQRQRLDDRLTVTEAELDNLRLHESAEAHAREVVQPAMKALREQGLPVKAFRQARSVHELLKHDRAFQEEWASLTATVSCTHLPLGTRVLARDALSPNDRWLYLGTVPFVHLQVPRGYVRLRLEHDEYVPREMQMKFPTGLANLPANHLEKKSDSRPGMVLVTKTQAADHVPANMAIRNDFWIDRHEVTNQEYQAFVLAGGYAEPKYWADLPFVLDGEQLTWETARMHFLDQTGVCAPAGWRDGRLVPGTENQPVAGISWFEANAYARFRGKSLPTITHWRRAAFCDQPGVMATLSNFSSPQTADVGTFPGIGNFDVYDLYGNVSEWCWNGDPSGKRVLLGGAYDDPNYHYVFPRLVSPWQRKDTCGFRCVEYSAEGEPTEAMLSHVEARKPNVLPEERLPLQDVAQWYVYDRNLPLHATTIEEDSDDGFNDVFRHEVVEVDGPGARERLTLHLLIPREATQPLESLIIVPGIGRYNASGTFSFNGKLEFAYSRDLASKGRAVCFPIFRGTFDRWAGMTLGKAFSQTPVTARNDWVYVGQEISRTVDYLLTRDDIDPDKIMAFGISNGANRLVMALAVDDRIRAGVLLGGGYTRWHLKRPAICEYHFAPHVHQPVLMVNGLDDVIHTYDSSQIPLFEWLGSQEKRHVVFPAPHLPERQDVMTATEDWLERVISKP